MGQIKNIKLHIVTDIKVSVAVDKVRYESVDTSFTESCSRMHLKYYLDNEGKRVYTLQNVDPEGKPTLSAHPARFSPDDKYSKYRILLKKRFGILLTQTPAPAV